MNATHAHRTRQHWQWGSLAAAGAGILLIVAVQALDGGRVLSLLQLPAAIIVFGGTVAATMVSYSPATMREALREAREAFRTPDEDFNALSTELVTIAIRAHRRGLLALDSQLDTVSDPFLRNGLTLVIDGASNEMLRDALQIERQAQDAREDTPARIFETAAGYAPTLGILGAVLGLIRVMENLPNPAALGSGIAIAFVATLYGVGSANLVLLPVAARLRERASARARRRDLMTETLLDVQRRIHPRLVAHKTRGFAPALPRIDEIARRLSADTLETQAPA